MSALAEHSEASVVQATEPWGEAKGICRFFNNACVYTDRIAPPDCVMAIVTAPACARHWRQGT